MNISAHPNAGLPNAFGEYDQTPKEMQALIKLWAMAKPETRTIALLARKSGVDYSTVTRIWNGKNPECQNALALLVVISTKEEALHYLKNHFPAAARFHERELTTPVFSDHESLRPQLDKLVNFVLLSLAYGGQARRSYRCHPLLQSSSLSPRSSSQLSLRRV